jgi:hypothetical protein
VLRRRRRWRCGSHAAGPRSWRSCQ